MSVPEMVLETIAKVANKIFGSANERELVRLWPLVLQVNDAWEAIQPLSDEQLTAKTAEFRRRLIEGESEDDILPEAFAVCREAAHRTLGGGRIVEARYDQLVLEKGRFRYKPVEGGKIRYFAHFDVQVLGGIVLHKGKIAEMVTGEGKTLVATLAAYLNALRPTEEWVETARRLQGEDVSGWTFQTYGVYRNEDGSEGYRFVDHPVPGEDVTYVPPRRFVPISRGVHVVTVNDYLAGRDAQDNKPLFDALGITVGAVQSSMHSPERIPVYACDIVYGTNNEFGFDYLRDNLKVDPNQQVQRSHFFAVVDEVDSVLIDEARTPLIISGSASEATDKYYQADRIARQLKGGDNNVVEEKIGSLMKQQGMQREDARQAAEEDWDFVYSERDGTAKLTERGMHRVVRILGTDDIYSGANLDMPHFIDNALRAHALYKKDHHYIVEHGQVNIVDEHTGRVLEGRRWSDGLHQAVEAKEHLKIKAESQTIASITFQNFFRMYDKLAGMTGTAMTEAKEFLSIYKLGVASIPTNRPLRRVNHPDLIFGTEKEKYKAIAEHVAEMHKTGRPILVGTVSVERSELISEMLDRRGVKHEVLNAKHHAREAEIVSKAGQIGQVTVATNMAGRGTDIKLGAVELPELLEHWKRWGLVPKKGLSPEMPLEELEEALLRHWVSYYLEDVADDFQSKTVAQWRKLLQKRLDELWLTGPVVCASVAELGGLHIVGTERHEARRIDNQLRGRSGRQGDPGSSRFFLALEDDLVRLFAPERMANLMRSMGLSDGIPIESRMVSRTIENAQRKVEERNFEIRKNLLEYDQVMNEQRTIIYDKRQAWLKGENLREDVLGFCLEHVAIAVPPYMEAHPDDWDYPAIQRFMLEAFFIEVPLAELMSVKTERNPQEAMIELLQERVEKAYEAKKKQIGESSQRTLEKLVLLEIVDRKWMDHLYAMDLLKGGIHLWGYAGQDPKLRYKREGYEMFRELWDSLQAEVAELILKVKPAEEMKVSSQVEIEETVHDEFDAYAQEADQRGAGAGAEAHVAQIVNTGKKVKPNEPCPCGSGKKYKKCCGR